jgi:hypothetical protein
MALQHFQNLKLNGMGNRFEDFGQPLQIVLGIIALGLLHGAKVLNILIFNKLMIY